MKKKQMQMKAMGTAAVRKVPTALEQLGMTERTFRQAMADAAPIDILHEHLLGFAFTEEERYAVELYCTKIALFCGGMRTERGQRLLAAGFADERGTILRTVEAWRDAQAYAKQNSISVWNGGMPTM